LSAHASHEELFLFKRLAEELIGSAAKAITVTWTYSDKPQPANSKFKVPPVDAPNVNGARLFGLAAGDVKSEVGPPDVSKLRSAVESGRVSALFVFDPGPDGSLGDTSWIVEARTKGSLPLLIVQGVVLTDLARAADVVLPGASYVEKEASYTNDQGRLQGTARAIPTPGDAKEDWSILVGLARALGVPFEYGDAAQVRADIAARIKDLDGITTLAFAQPVNAKHGRQAANPSERWKWDFMYQDLPPVKGTVDPSSLPLPPGAVPLKQV